MISCNYVYRKSLQKNQIIHVFRGFMMKNAFFVFLLTVSTVAINASMSEQDAAVLRSFYPDVVCCDTDALVESNPLPNPLHEAVVTAGTTLYGFAVKAKDKAVEVGNSAYVAGVSAKNTAAPYVPKPVVDAKHYVSGKFAEAKDWAYPATVEEKSRMSKMWNATVFGHEGAGKYVIVSAVTAAALVAAYAAYCFAQPTLEDQVVALVGKAQENPNVVLQELPGILAQCSNDDVRVEVLHYVLSQVVITPEIAAAFNLQQ